MTVNGARASFTHAGQELSITPRHKLKPGRWFVVSVAYGGVPEPIVDPDESLEGWVVPDADPDGAFVVNEPQGAPGWFPVNDTPRDKATYDFRITVPAGHTALANGRLLSKRTRHGRTTWRWAEDSPMSSYLVDGHQRPVPDALRSAAERAAAVQRGRSRHARERVGPAQIRTWPGSVSPPQPEIISFFSKLYGPYAFSSVGSIVDWAPNVGYALESQTKPNFDRIPDAATVVHELAHQWFGDAVTPAIWPDIWLNEGFATWSEWIYDERHGGDPASVQFDATCARSRRAARKARTSGSRLRPPWRARISCSARPCTRAAR